MSKNPHKTTIANSVCPYDGQSIQMKYVSVELYGPSMFPIASELIQEKCLASSFTEKCQSCEYK